MANQKGGVAKTTTVASLGAAMTELGNQIALAVHFAALGKIDPDVAPLDLMPFIAGGSPAVARDAFEAMPRVTWKPSRASSRAMDSACERSVLIARFAGSLARWSTSLSRPMNSGCPPRGGLAELRELRAVCGPAGKVPTVARRPPKESVR